jgi:hypothetical protein
MPGGVWRRPGNRKGRCLEHTCKRHGYLNAGLQWFEAARTLRDDRKTGGITILAFTAFNETEVCRHLVDHEFDGYCQKGQPPTNLFALMASFTTDLSWQHTSFCHFRICSSQICPSQRPAFLT